MEGSSKWVLIRSDSDHLWFHRMSTKAEFNCFSLTRRSLDDDGRPVQSKKPKAIDKKDRIKTTLFPIDAVSFIIFKCFKYPLKKFALIKSLEKVSLIVIHSLECSQMLLVHQTQTAYEPIRAQQAGPFVSEIRSENRSGRAQATPQISSRFRFGRWVGWVRPELGWTGG